MTVYMDGKAIGKIEDFEENEIECDFAVNELERDKLRRWYLEYRKRIAEEIKRNGKLF